jgi:Cu+-exporting ATPase
VGAYPVQKKSDVKGEKVEAVIDPVCGMEVGDIKKAPWEEYKGKVYYFCAEHCRKTFKKTPWSYIKEKTQFGENPGRKH